MNQENPVSNVKTDGFNSLKKVVFKLIDSATLRAKNRRTSIGVPGAIIKMSPSDLSVVSSLIGIANLTHEYDRITLKYVDDNDLVLKTTNVTIGILRNISSYLIDLSLRIDLKASYRLYKLSECKTNDELIKMISDINTEEEAIEKDYLEQH